MKHTAMVNAMREVTEALGARRTSVLRLTDPLEPDPAMPVVDPQWENVLAENAVAQKAKEAEASAARAADFAGKTPEKIAAELAHQARTPYYRR